MIALDTNIFVYSLDSRDPVKQHKAQALLLSLRGSPQVRMPWQVLVESINQIRYLTRQGVITQQDCDQALVNLPVLFPLAAPALPVLERALDLLNRFSLSYWDALLLGACVEGGVQQLYTEDMGALAQYDSVQLINPLV